MKIWILGAEGMLGSALTHLCHAQGIEVHSSGRSEADVTDFDGMLASGLEIVPTHIVNCAAYTNVDGAEKEPETAFAVNAQGAANAAQVAQDLDARLIHISTDYVFDGKKTEPRQEHEECAPINCYGKSKWEGEKLVLRHFPHACVMRTSWLFGGKGKNFISSILEGLRMKEELKVVSDQCGKPTYCKEAAEAILHLLDCNGIIHFAGSEAMSRYEIACRLFEAAKERGMQLKCQKITPVLSSTFPTPAPRPAYSVLATEKYTQLTHRQPKPWSAVMKDLFEHEI